MHRLTQSRRLFNNFSGNSKSSLSPFNFKAVLYVTGVEMIDLAQTDAFAIQSPHVINWHNKGLSACAVEVALNGQTWPNPNVTSATYPNSVPPTTYCHQFHHQQVILRSSVGIGQTSQMLLNVRTWLRDLTAALLVSFSLNLWHVKWIGPNLIL